MHGECNNNVIISGMMEQHHMIHHSMDECKTPPNEPNDKSYITDSPNSVGNYYSSNASHIVTPERKKIPSSPPGLNKKRERLEFNKNDIYSIPSFPSFNEKGCSIFNNFIPTESGSGTCFTESYSNFTKNTPTGNWRNTNNSFVPNSLYSKNPEKEERNKEVLKKIKVLLSKNNGLFPYDSLKELHPTLSDMPNNKLINFINQLISNGNTDDIIVDGSYVINGISIKKISSDIEDFLKQNAIYSHATEPIYTSGQIIKISVFRAVKRINCRCCFTDDFFCNKLCQIKTITINKQMKYSELYDMLINNGFIKNLCPKYTHKSDRKEEHPYFPTHGGNLHFNGFSDLSVYFV